MELGTILKFQSCIIYYDFCAGASNIFMNNISGEFLIAGTFEKKKLQHIKLTIASVRIMFRR